MRSSLFFSARLHTSGTESLWETNIQTENQPKIIRAYFLSEITLLSHSYISKEK